MDEFKIDDLKTPFPSKGLNFDEPKLDVPNSAAPKSLSPPREQNTAEEPSKSDTPVSQDADAGDLPPLRVRIYSNPDGELVKIIVDDFSIGTDFTSLRSRFRELAGVVEKDVFENLAVEIDPDSELRFEYLVQALSACSGYLNKDGNWTPIARHLFLSPPRINHQ